MTGTAAGPVAAGDHTHVEVRRAYADSVTLLQASRDVAAAPGVLAAQVAMATPLNLDVLAGMGFQVPPCAPDDMVVALRVARRDDLGPALEAVDAALARAEARSAVPGAPAEEVPPRTTRAALRRSGAPLALVSVPGRHAFVEAMDALDAGCDVMVFSDNVPVWQELALKQAAAERGLLVMGPDCGTAVVGGLGLGFANSVRPGPVGVVAASGTGCQQLLCLLDAAGVGVGNALGLGGRDLSEEVGGLSAREALRRLDADPSVELVVVVSKPPASRVREDLEAFARALGTPVLLALLGPGSPDLTATAETALDVLGRPAPVWPRWGEARPPAGGRFLRALYAGGTLCEEAMLVAGGRLGPVRGSTPLAAGGAADADAPAGGSPAVEGHLFLDLGDDAYTQGRAHPMIDPTLRLEHLARLGDDPDTAVVLVDVVLGHGADPDPSSSLAPVVRALGRPVVVACVGAAADPQDLERQAAALADAGAEVYLSNAQAARRAAALVEAASG